MVYLQRNPTIGESGEGHSDFPIGIIYMVFNATRMGRVGVVPGTGCVKV